MPDYVQLPPDGTGKRLLATKATIGGVDVYLECDRITGADGTSADVRTTDPAGTAGALVTRVVEHVDPVRDALFSSALAAGSSADLDGSNVADGTTGKLAACTLASTAACKWEIKTLSGAIEETMDVVITGGLTGTPTFAWKPPHKNFATLAGGVTVNFRVTATNLDALNPANVYATLYWDEV